MNKKLKALPFQVVEMEDELLLKRGLSTMVIPDKSAMVVIRVIQKALAKKPYTAEELAGLFAANTRELILNFIEHLLKKRFVVYENGCPAVPAESETPQDIFYWHFNKYQDEIAVRLNERKVSLIGINTLTKKLLKALQREHTNQVLVIDDPSLRNVTYFDDEFEITDSFWKSSDIKIIEADAAAESIGDIGFMVAASEFGSFYLLETWNQFAVQNNIPFYPGVLQNMVGYAGPLVIPGESACLKCLKHRQNSNSPGFNEKRYAEKFAFQTQQTVAYHQSMLGVLAEVIIFDLVKFINNIQWEVGSFCEIDLLSGNMKKRKLIKAPRCRTCSSASKRPVINIHKQMTTDAAWQEIEQTVGYDE
ncbi:MAG: hypothetical protein JJU13_05840 [Balneolaceae bacterium]|nr:hypothetical protein [Balneolaceae bacterium]